MRGLSVQTLKQVQGDGIRCRVTVCTSGGRFTAQGAVYGSASICVCESYTDHSTSSGAAVIPGADPESVEMNAGLFVLEGASRIGTDPETSSG